MEMCDGSIRFTLYDIRCLLQLDAIQAQLLRDRIAVAAMMTATTLTVRRTATGTRRIVALRADAAFVIALRVASITVRAVVLVVRGRVLAMRGSMVTERGPHLARRTCAGRCGVGRVEQAALNDVYIEHPELALRLGVDRLQMAFGQVALAIPLIPLSAVVVEVHSDVQIVAAASSC